MPGVARQTGQHGDYDLAGNAKWKGSLAVAFGDLVFRDTDGYDKPGSSITYQGTGAVTSAGNTILTQELFHDRFRGVSAARRTTLQTVDGDHVQDGGIITSGEFEFPCDSGLANQPVGNYVALANNANVMFNANVTAANGNATLSIGKVSRDYITGSATIFVKIIPVLSTGGGVVAPA